MLSSSLQPRRVPCQERGERRVAELIEAAESVIAENGYEATTMSAIAERAGASIGSLYQFFPNKAAITQALRTDYGRQFDAVCSPLAAEAKARTLRHFVGRLIDVTTQFLDSHPAFLSLLDAPRSTRSLPEIRNLLVERFASFFLTRNPRLSKVKATTLAIVTIQIMKALNQLYTELPPGERRQLIREYNLVLHSYLRASLEPAPSVRRLR